MDWDHRESYTMGNQLRQAHSLIPRSETGIEEKGCAPATEYRPFADRPDTAAIRGSGGGQLLPVVPEDLAPVRSQRSKPGITTDRGRHAANAAVPHADVDGGMRGRSQPAVTRPRCAEGVARLNEELRARSRGP